MNACIENVAPGTALSFELPFKTVGLQALSENASGQTVATLPRLELAPATQPRQQGFGNALSSILGKLRALARSHAKAEKTVIPRFVHVCVHELQASSEQLLDASLRARPVLIGSKVVNSASLGARQRGVGARMHLRDARVLCPEAVILPGSYERLAELAERVLSVLQSYGENLEPGQTEEFYLDFAKADFTREKFETILRGLQAEILQRTGLRVSLGAGSTKIVAQMASQFEGPGGLRIIEYGSERAFLDSLPVRNLGEPITANCGVLADDGVTSMAEFRRIPKAVLINAFGEAVGKVLWHRARGADGDPKEAQRQKTTLRRCLRRGPTADWRELERRVQYLASRVCLALGNQSRLAQDVGLRVSFADGYIAQQTVCLAAPTDNELEIFRAAEELLEQLYRSSVPISEISVSATIADPPMLDEKALETKQAAVEPGWRLSFGRSCRFATRSDNNEGFVLADPCLSR
jgi:DNA polymerase IV